MTASNVATPRQRGTLIKLPDSTPGLLIVGGEQKSFVLEGLWRSPTAPAVGLAVEVELSADGAVTSIHAVDSQKIALEQGQRVADVARKAAMQIVPRMGKPALIALAVLWVSWFFLPAFDWGIVSFTFWELLGLDTSNVFTLARGSKPGLVNLVGLAAIAAPLAAPFVTSPRARWLYAAPLAFVLVCLLRAGAGLYSLDDAASSGAGALGSGMGEVMAEMQAAARQAMLEQLVSGLGAGLWLTVLASGALALRALRGGSTVAAGPMAGTAPIMKSLDRRVAIAVAAAAAAVAVAASAVALVGRALQSPQDRMTGLFSELSTTIEDAKGDCPKLGKALKAFVDQRGDDFSELAKLSPDELKAVEQTFLLEQQKAQNAIGNSYMLCANYREFAEGSRAMNDAVKPVVAAMVSANAKLMNPASGRLVPAAEALAAPELSLWDKLFSSSKGKPAAPTAPTKPPVPAPPALTPAAAQPQVTEVVAPQPVAPIPAAPVPPSPAPAEKASVETVKYAVFNVAAGDTLNARLEPSFGAPKVFDLAPGQTDVAGGKPSGKLGDQWVEIVRADVRGWVNRSFLVEHHLNPCSDARVPALAEKLAQVVVRRDGAALSSMVSPIHGLEIRGDIEHAGAHFNQSRTAELFASTTSHAFGGGIARGPFKDVMLPLLTRALGAPHTPICGRIVQPPSSTKPSTWPVERRALLPLSLSPEQAGSDSATWVLGIEFVDGVPRMSTLTQYAPATRPAAAAAAPAPAAVKPAAPTTVAAPAKAPDKDGAKAAAPSPPTPEPAPADEKAKRKRRTRAGN